MKQASETADFPRFLDMLGANALARGMTEEILAEILNGIDDERRDLRSS